MTIEQNFSNTRDPFRRLVCHLKMSAAETLSKNEYLAKNQSFKEKFENLKTISQPGTLSADIPASYKGFYSNYNPPINFRIARREQILTFLYFPVKHLRSAFLCHYKTSSVFFQGNKETTAERFLKDFLNHTFKFLCEGKG